MSNGKPRGIMFLTADIKKEHQVVDETVPGSIPDIPAFLELGSTLEEHFDFVWLTDNPGYRSTWVLLANMAREWKNVDLGIMTTWMYGRNPLETTEIASSIAELMPDREFVLGLSRGNRIVTSTFEPHRPVRVQYESIKFMRELQAGNRIQLDEYPALMEVSGFRSDRTAQLYMEQQDFPIFVGSTGPTTLTMAGEAADGAVFNTQQPNQSLEAYSRGIYQNVSGIQEVRDGRKKSDIEDFRLNQGISLCVSRDGELAKEFARREVSGIVASKSDEILESIGMDRERTEKVKQAVDEGAGFDEPSKYVSDEMRDKLIFSGTPDEVIDKVAETYEYGVQEGFDKQFFCLPLGPDLKEAVTLITEDILPRL